MRPNFAILAERKIKGVTVLDIDTSQAKYQDRKWREMGDFGKRKFDNMLFFMKMEQQRQRLTVRYV